MNRSWHPTSYSVQARNMCNSWIEGINNGYLLIDEVLYKVRVSYRQPLVKERALRRFTRLVKAGKVHNNLEKYKENYPNWQEHREKMAQSRWGLDI